MRIVVRPALILVLLGGASIVACGIGAEGMEIGVDASDAAEQPDALASDGPVGSSLDAHDEVLPDVRSDQSVLVDAAVDHPESDAGADASSSQDAGLDADTSNADACESGGVENCTDGIDNDCDGLVDCADPQCTQQGFSCAPEIPAGWAAVAFEQGTQSGSCPSGWSAAASYVEGPTGANECTCSCGAPAGNPCVVGSLSLSLGGGVLNACSCATNIPLVSTGGCDAIGSAIGGCLGGFANGSVAPLAPSPVACSATATLRPVTYGSEGQSCSLTSPSSGGGCTSGGACLPATTPGVACVAHSGQVACPVGYPSAHTTYAPGDVIDERACDACSCSMTPSACAAPALTLFSDDSCNTSVANIQVTGSCANITGNPTGAKRFNYTATPTGGACTGPATVSTTGQVVANNPVTVCCQ